ncbi:winged helix-turn-helix domain-containing protein [Spirulina sp. 06S082]|uniref:winged helix-turn-helix domain-containing protein n=1 Tax=Spirulina sp. 06S082 TaxID=3110248 RepID=UPI002B21F91D|nr:winged helix-turn-helix domain-containing protein [Spirulina sp. 06S082]MEA5469033.1 winged helix-turn-helix domain-containing protein [Spirulina sp. 06S082]
MRAMEFSPEHWKSHDQGKKTRLRLLEYLDDNPKASTAEIAHNLGRSPRQVKRQLSRLKEEGILRYDRKWLIAHNNSFFIPKFLRRVMAFLGRPARRRPRGQGCSPIQLHIDRSTADAIYFTLDAVDWMELSLALDFGELKSQKQKEQLLKGDLKEDDLSRFMELQKCHIRYLKQNSPRFKVLCKQMETMSAGKTIYIAKTLKTKTFNKTKTD